MGIESGNFSGEPKIDDKPDKSGELENPARREFILNIAKNLTGYNKETKQRIKKMPSKEQNLADKIVSVMNTKIRRREAMGLLTGMGIGLTIFGAIGGARSLVKDVIFKRKIKKIFKEESEEEEERKVSEEEASEKMSSSADIIKFNEEWSLTPEITLGRIKEYWKKMYEGNPDYFQKEKDKSRCVNLRQSLLKAYEEMSAWDEELKMIFSKAGVNANYRFLAIPESHWKIYSPEKREQGWTSRKIEGSRAGAAGLYQFTRETATNAKGLRGEENILFIAPAIDERNDPIKSARACANNLAYLYENSGNWETALSGYNGGFLWSYLVEREKGEEKSYGNYLEHLEKEIKAINREVNNGLHKCRVQSESFQYLSELYGVSVDEICRVNNWKRNDPKSIKKGDRIKIPSGGTRKKNAIFEIRVSGYAENIDYPAKLLAVLEVIEKDKNHLPHKERVRYKTIKIEKAPEYKIAAGDTMMSIARKFGVTLKELLRKNPQVQNRANKLKLGEIIKNPNVIDTLEKIATRRKASLDRLIYLNPAILNPSAVLPEGYEVRV